MNIFVIHISRRGLFTSVSNSVVQGATMDAPHGQGKQTDVMISIKRYPEIYNKGLKDQPFRWITFEFCGEGNGINAVGKDQFTNESKFPFVYEAPRDGYELKTFSQASYFPREPKLNIPLANFTFRIRTKFDELGNICHAFYGQLNGEKDHYSKQVDRINTQGGGRGGGIALLCTYWVNPTPNDRNLEPARNKDGQLIPYDGPLPE